MIRTIQPIKQTISFSPTSQPIESAIDRLHRLLILESVGTPINQDVLLKAEEAARLEARQVA